MSPELELTQLTPRYRPNIDTESQLRAGQNGIARVTSHVGAAAGRYSSGRSDIARTTTRESSAGEVDSVREASTIGLVKP
jgi:hypothetical protein